MWSAGKRLAVFSIREDQGGKVWVRAGTAYCNKDGSLNVVLDALPLNGRLHVRAVMDKRVLETEKHAPEVTAELAGT